ncbi:MAG: hypothetical protein GWO07_02405 [Candidatus Dadabacteria bacterium]|nr:hypothetical protein [Candidatus Dadabacteria bacterium]NIS07620.1 hypothetical protein [Candidatus Dadabacteria bacterium]NIV42074.1 hypothetical protein [Candidatus Dadabacteria bacterium]NIX16479.1 hypothetical protein [Candidatus Dadabacteria bacterium]NIY21258.1 hypothetical protein [Candidatus Dadabacteria bacterium]
MLVRNFFIIIFLLTGIIITGCSPIKIINYKDIDNNINYSYEIIEIPDFDKTEENWVPYDSNTIIPDMVAKSLESQYAHIEITRTSSEFFRPRSSVSGKNILLVKGKVTNYSRGCKYCEWFLRRNDKGKSSVTVRINLIDKSTGEIIADKSIEGRAKKPGYGESRYIRVRDEIVSLVEKVTTNNS